MFKKNVPCPGTINGCKCPYNTGDKKTCKVHVNTLTYVNFIGKKSYMVSWIEESNIECCMCGEQTKVTACKKKKHHYCKNCIEETCTICISMEEHSCVS